MPDNIFKGSYESASSQKWTADSQKSSVFDADGTICDIEKEDTGQCCRGDYKTGEEWPSGMAVYRKKQAFVHDYLEQIPFTGMISACGCTIEKDGKRLFNKEMTTEAAWHSVEVLRKYGMIPVMEGADWMYYDKDEYNTDINWYADLITKALGAKWRPVKGYEHDLHINKISSKIVPGSDPEKACAELEDYYEFIGHVGEGLAGDTIEMIPKGFSKAVGIAAVCRIFDIAHEDTIVFGDSNNDLSMFEYAKTKVAMGNAASGIKKLADYVTTDIFHYGIKNGLEHLGLI